MTTHKNLTILGLGLIGSSVARAAKQFGVAENITAFDSNPLTLELGKQQGFIDVCVDSIEAALKDADFVVIATPPSSSLELIPDIAKHISQGAHITDVLSVKTPIAQALKERMPQGVLAIPSHPIAGSEKTGAAAGRADLFAGKRVIMTPAAPEDKGIRAITAFWEALGAEVEYMPPEIHDSVYAYVSHLPQLLAFGYAPYAAKLALEADVPPHFSQFTRLCKSDRHLWDDIFLHNKQELDTAMARFLVLLAHIRSELAGGDQENSEENASQSEQGAELKEVSQVKIWGHWLPRLIASCLVATLAQHSRDVGFNFARFAGGGFEDFTAPLAGEPDGDMEDISKHAPQVTAALDELLATLSESVVTKD